MKNPVYYEYRRSSRLGVIVVVALATLGATLHYFRSVEQRVSQTTAHLHTLSQQLDAEFAPVLAFSQAMRRAALTKLTLPPLVTAPESVPLLQLADGTVHESSTFTDAQMQTELQMLGQLKPYFDLAEQTQPHLLAIYYFSEQGFVYHGQAKWSDYVSDQITSWQRNNAAEPSYEREQIFYAEFISGQAALSLPLYQADRKLGRLVFALKLQPLLEPLYQQYANTEFMLLDQSGELISSSVDSRLQSVNQHMLQIQRLRTMPWSLGVLEHKTSLFAAGLADFVWHWLSYALLLGCLLIALQYRFRRRTVSAVNRLLVHIDRLSKGQMQGVRHVPDGWTEVFDKVASLPVADKAAD
ncbi:MAG: cache domain-containing protein [Chromatiaceae bacterium]|nr:cache domain-containing protein [Chromatiaceae bacterium]